ncbi:hypothetical protein BRADI_2g16965v3 [Brachypodium distachyon]|uniref:Uncharacterized protein n=1 Tax=Brachypodium distachyon TaxID=15368 RepID=A0A0Q3IWY1_BRADI|nr:hypothetical protein BRADI_2g16965v3 [Brachypodium distachyon]
MRRRQRAGAVAAQHLECGDGSPLGRWRSMVWRAAAAARWRDIGSLGPGAVEAAWDRRNGERDERSAAFLFYFIFITTNTKSKKCTRLILPGVLGSDGHRRICLIVKVQVILAAYALPCFCTHELSMEFKLS